MEELRQGMGEGEWAQQRLGEYSEPLQEMVEEGTRELAHAQEWLVSREKPPALWATIEVETEMGEGSTFTLILPIGGAEDK